MKNTYLATQARLRICNTVRRSYFFWLWISVECTDQTALSYQLAGSLVPALETSIKDTTQHRFIAYEKNHLFLPQKNTLKPFYAALDTLKYTQHGQVNIVHFGDSHIQADYFTGQIRKRFHQQADWGNGGRGYLFPCGLITRTYDPSTIVLKKYGRWEGCRNIETKKRCSWGLAGMVATTYDVEASFDIKPKAIGTTYLTDRVRLYYPTDQASLFNPRIWDGYGFLPPHRIFKDGYAEFILTQPTHQVGISFQKNRLSQDHFTFQGVALASKQSGVVYHSVGVNGAKVTSFLGSTQLATHIKSLQPNLVIISLGTNDCYKINFNTQHFKASYQQLIQQVRRTCPKAAILLTTPGDTYLRDYRYNPHTLKVNNILYELARQYNLAVWDLYQVMGGYSSIGKWQAARLAAKDRVHFSKTGYEIQGDLFYEALLEAYKAH
ncbi:MAG: GDSL-type esterase/lipase family protein [Thermonemataceae bacterium]